MRLFSIKPTATATLPALGLFLVIHACGGSTNAVAQQAPDPVEGVWEGAVILKDCTSGTTLATFRGSQVFHSGGTMSDTNSLPTAGRGPGFGTWVRHGATSYTGKFRFFTYDVAGVPTGTARVTRNFTLSADGRTSSSTNTVVFEDLTGAVLRSACGSDAGARVL